MSTAMNTTTGLSLLGGVAPVGRRVRAYFAPVNRTAETPTIFDAAQSGGFVAGSPPAPWVDLGWCSGFARRCGTKIAPLLTGAPAIAQSQVRTEVEATVSLEFESWGKLQLALSSGTQQMNLLVTAPGAAVNGSGGVAGTAVALSTGSTATTLNVGTAAAQFSIGELVSVDVDYTGQVGFVGSGVSAAYVRQASDVGGDVNYIRRVTLNVGRVVGIANGTLQLGGALLAGVPVAGMQVSALTGFVDREGGTFFQEWSGLFCIDGEQGDRVLYHYPRLQTTQGAVEIAAPLAGELERVRLAGLFRALPVKDANDGATVVCFRSYIPGAMRAI